MPVTVDIVRKCKSAAPPTDAAELSLLGDRYSVISGIITFIASVARPDIAWVASFIARSTKSATLQHYALAVRVMQYLLTTADLALTYRRSGAVTTGALFTPGEDPTTSQPHLVSDASLTSPRSVSGWAFFLSHAAVFWKVMAQLDPSLSSGEAEFYALVSSIATGVHMRQLMEELGYVWLSPLLVFCDGKAARLMVQDGNATYNVRHIDLKWWFANHHVDQGHVMVRHVRGDKNPVNGLTKPTSGSPFYAERSYLLGVPPPASAVNASRVYAQVTHAMVNESTRHTAASVVARAWRSRR